MRSTDTTFSLSSVLKMRTPCVLRPAMRTSSTGHADQLAAVGDQHDLVALLDREGGHQPAVALVDDHGDDAFAAAAGDAVVVGRGALAEAALGHGQHVLLARRRARRSAAASDRRPPPPSSASASGAPSATSAPWRPPHGQRLLDVGRRARPASASTWRRIAIEITSSPLSRRMPRTPVESRPLNRRTSSTAKRMQRPAAVVSSTLSSTRTSCLGRRRQLSPASRR